MEDHPANLCILGSDRTAPDASGNGGIDPLKQNPSQQSDSVSAPPAGAYRELGGGCYLPPPRPPVESSRRGGHVFTPPGVVRNSA
jgi:hypothetical protein